MSLSVKYNDVELGKYINVTHGFTQFVGADWGPVVNDSHGIVRGNDFKYTSYGGKVIEMPFEIRKDLSGKYDQLQKALNVSEPKPLIFGSCPDRMYYAIPSGTLDFSQISYIGSGTITWVIPDGLAHAVTEKSFTATKNDSGIMETTIINNGTEAVPVDYTIKHSHENGYVGIVSEHGVIQLGKVEEPDGENYKQSELLVNVVDGEMTSGALAGFQQGVATLLPIGADQNGELASIKMVTFNGDAEDVVVLKNRGSGSNIWKGGSMTKQIGPDSEGKTTAKNFHAVMKHALMLGTPYQVGVTQFCITTKDKKNLAGIQFLKNNLSDQCDVQFYISGRKVGNKVVSAHAFPEINLYMTWNIGHHSITKTGDIIDFYFGAQHHEYRLTAEEAKMEAYEVSYYLGALDGYDPITIQAIRGLHFRKDNVEKWRDIPNRYQDGDVIYIDGSATKVYVNGILRSRDEILGSNYPLAPPGETKVQFSYSAFCDPAPDISVKIREAYL